jgi:hypothetical protein
MFGTVGMPQARLHFQRLRGPPTLPDDLNWLMIAGAKAVQTAPHSRAFKSFILWIFEP